jgi:hypothetical protein
MQIYSTFTGCVPIMVICKVINMRMSSAAGYHYPNSLRRKPVRGENTNISNKRNRVLLPENVSDGRRLGIGQVDDDVNDNEKGSKKEGKVPKGPSKEDDSEDKGATGTKKSQDDADSGDDYDDDEYEETEGGKESKSKGSKSNQGKAKNGKENATEGKYKFLIL